MKVKKTLTLKETLKTLKKAVTSKEFMYLSVMAVTAFTVLGVTDAFALDPTGFSAESSFGYTFYEYGVEKGIKGPLGFVGGVFSVVAGVALGIQNKYLPAIATTICGAALIGAPAVVKSMGMIF